jgi:malonyl-CoA/methylmalonyl-CoA synthetase
MAPCIDLADRIEELADLDPQHTFLTTPEGRRISYGGLGEQSGRIAAALIGRGVVPGDRVAVQVEKSPEAVLLYAACLRIGAVFVPINMANTPAEVAHFFSDAEPRMAIIDPARAALIEPIARHAGIDQVDTLGSAADGSLMNFPPQAAATPAATRAYRDVQPAGTPALAAIVYTSGTTGRSKGAMLTRANLASNAAVLAEAWHFSRRDVLLHVLPLFHIHGLFAAINTVLASGSSMLMAAKFDAAQSVGLLPQASVFMGVPTHYTRLLQQTELTAETTAQMRLFVSGSAPLLKETHRAFAERTGHVILERYGMTETLINTSNPYAGVRLPGSVGPPLPGISVRVADPGAAQPDLIGVLEVTGPNVFAGYWRDPVKTQAEFTADGWFKTGDLGRIDPEGYVHIVGRAKDLVISGGYNVYPKEVESELDAVAGVLESAVFGVPHPDFGEGVTAAIVPQPGVTLAEDEIIAVVAARLARYKLPKRVLLVSELPRNAMGKVQKNVLRQQFGSLYRTE